MQDRPVPLFYEAIAKQEKDLKTFDLVLDSDKKDNGDVGFLSRVFDGVSVREEFIQPLFTFLEEHKGEAKSYLDLDRCVDQFSSVSVKKQSVFDDQGGLQEWVKALLPGIDHKALSQLLREHIFGQAYLWAENQDDWLNDFFPKKEDHDRLELLRKKIDPLLITALFTAGLSSIILTNTLSQKLDHHNNNLIQIIVRLVQVQSSANTVFISEYLQFVRLIADKLSLKRTSEVRVFRRHLDDCTKRFPCVDAGSLIPQLQKENIMLVKDASSVKTTYTSIDDEVARGREVFDFKSDLNTFNRARLQSLIVLLQTTNGPDVKELKAAAPGGTRLTSDPMDRWTLIYSKLHMGLRAFDGCDAAQREEAEALFLDLSKAPDCSHLNPDEIERWTDICLKLQMVSQELKRDGLDPTLRDAGQTLYNALLISVCRLKKWGHAKRLDHLIAALQFENQQYALVYIEILKYDFCFCAYAGNNHTVSALFSSATTTMEVANLNEYVPMLRLANTITMPGMAEESKSYVAIFLQREDQFRLLQMGRNDPTGPRAIAKFNLWMNGLNIIAKQEAYSRHSFSSDLRPKATTPTFFEKFNLLILMAEHYPVPPFISDILDDCLLKLNNPIHHAALTAELDAVMRLLKKLLRRDVSKPYSIELHNYPEAVASPEVKGHAPDEKLQDSVAELLGSIKILSIVRLKRVFLDNEITSICTPSVAPTMSRTATRVSNPNALALRAVAVTRSIHVLPEHSERVRCMLRDLRLLNTWIENNNNVLSQAARLVYNDACVVIKTELERNLTNPDLTTTHEIISDVYARLRSPQASLTRLITYSKTINSQPNRCGIAIGAVIVFVGVALVLAGLLLSPILGGISATFGVELGWTLLGVGAAMLGGGGVVCYNGQSSGLAKSLGAFLAEAQKPSVNAAEEISPLIPGGSGSRVVAPT